MSDWPVDDEVPTWELPRESTEWVGPIVVVLTKVDGTAIAQTDVELAVLPLRQRPTGGDWVAPDPEPGGTALGVLQAPVALPTMLGIWARAVNSPETPVIDPGGVGYIRRT